MFSNGAQSNCTIVERCRPRVPAPNDPAFVSRADRCRAYASSCRGAARVPLHALLRPPVRHSTQPGRCDRHGPQRDCKVLRVCNGRTCSSADHEAVARVWLGGSRCSIDPGPIARFCCGDFERPRGNDPFRAPSPRHPCHHARPGNLAIQRAVYWVPPSPSMIMSTGARSTCRPRQPDDAALGMSRSHASAHDRSDHARDGLFGFGPAAPRPSRGREGECRAVSAAEEVLLPWSRASCPRSCGATRSRPPRTAPRPLREPSRRGARGGDLAPEGASHERHRAERPSLLKRGYRCRRLARSVYVRGRPGTAGGPHWGIVAGSSCSRRRLRRERSSLLLRVRDRRLRPFGRRRQSARLDIAWFNGQPTGPTQGGSLHHGATPGASRLQVCAVKDPFRASRS